MHQLTNRRHLFLFLAFLCYVMSNPVAAQQYKKELGGIWASTGFNGLDKKVQYLYTAADLGNPPTGVIDKLYFLKSLNTPSTVTLSNFQVKLGYTQTPTFGTTGTTFYQNLTPVLFNASQVINGTGNAYFVIDIVQQFTLPTGTTLIVELVNSGASTNLFSVLASFGPAAPSNKALTSTDAAATTGTATTTWLDMGLDFTTIFSAPANNNCATATFKPMGSFCSPFLGNTVGATQSNAPVACGGATSSTAKDIWYSFVANGPTDSISVAGLGGFDPVIELFAGSCTTGLISLACSDDPQSGAATEVLAPGTLTAGQTYYFRVYGWNGIDGSFNACLKSDFVPAPVNDDCTFPTNLIPSGSCNSISGNTTGASEDLASQPCGGSTSTFANDLWYTFVATSAGDSVVVDPFDTFDPVLEIFSGSCSGLTQITCSDNPSFFDATEKVAPGTLIPGVTYIVRVYGFNGSEGIFNICVKSMAPITIANDDCSGAITLTGSTVCNATLGNSSGSNQSLPPALCGGVTSTGAKDIWYKFVASAPGDSVIVSRLLSYDPVLEIFSGTCNGLVSLACSDDVSAAATEKVAPGTLVAGQTYYVRVYGWAGTEGSFNICVKQAVTSNDNCAGAINILPSPTCSSSLYNSIGATQSLAPVACNGATSASALDVWFSFTASSAGDSIIVDPSGGFDAVVELFGGFSCSSLSSLACSDDPNTGTATEKIVTGNLVAGTTYRVRVYGWAGLTGSFSFCVKQPGLAPPSNDNCGITFQLTPGVTCAPQTFSNTNATQTLAPAACGGVPVGAALDVWFALGAATSNDTIIVSPVGNFNPVVEVFSGICGNPVSIGCSNNVFNASATEQLSPGGLTPGVFYWVRVYGLNGTQGQFTICAKRGTTVAPPSNDNCSGATVVVPSANCSGQTFSNAGATQSQAAVLCSGATSTLANDVWFTFVASGSGDSVIVTPQGTFDAVVELFSGTFCTGLTSVACSDNPTVGTATEKISTGTLVAGNTYRVRVYGWNGIEGQFGFCVRQSTTTAPANDNCLNAINLIPSATCNSITYNSTNATQSIAPATCSGTTSSSARDVWFTFTASNAGDSIIVTPNGTFDPVLQLFGGSSCSNLVPLICSDNPGSAREIIAFGGLSVGIVYRIRVYGWAGTTGAFSICIKQPGGSAPANDNCTASITLTPNLFCNPQTFTTVGATQSLVPTACGSIPSNTAQDVWFKFGPVITQNDTVIVSPVGSFNPVVEFYSGLCTNLTSLACSNNPFNPAAVEKVSPGSLNLSMIYYVRVYGFNGSQGQFNICVKAGGTGPVITNDNCATATNVTVSQVCNPQNGSNNGATQSLAPVVCNGGTSTSAPDVWYKFTAVTPGDSVLVVGDFDPITELFSGTCNNLVSLACSDGPSATDTEVLAPGNLTPGQTYYFRVYGYNGSFGNFVYCVKRSANCNSVAGTFSISPTETVSNSLAILNLSGSSTGASVQWQVSTDNISWSNAGTPVFQVSDTFYITSATTQTYYLRGQVTLGTCATANSNSAALVVSCATPLTNKEPALSGFGISAFSFAGINNSSISVAPSGAYQNFRLITGQACRGGTYPYNITGLQNNQSAKAVWIDFNNNGSFEDFGENVVAPVVASGNLSGNISIPANVQIGTVRMRVMLFSPGTSTPTANPCFAGPYAAGEIEEYSLNISAAPTIANAGSNASTCSSTYALSANTPAVGTGQWSVVSGSGTFSNNSSPTASVSGLSIGVNVLRWTISTACSSTTSQVTITVTGSGQTASAGSDQSVCGGQVTLAANTPSAGTGLWTVVSGSGTFANPASPATTVTGLASGNNVYRWTITNPPCQPVFDEVQISNLGGTAVTAQAGADQSLCGPAATLAGNSPGTGVGLWTLVAGAGTISNPSSPNAQISNLGVENNVFRWTITTGNCPPSFDDVVISRVAAPSVAFAGVDQNICTNSGTLTATAPSVGNGLWTLVAGSGQILDATNAQTQVTGLGTGANTFRWTISNSPCAASTDEVIINSTTNAVAAVAGQDQVLCSETAQLSGNNAGTGTGTWTVVSGSGTFTNANSPTTQVTALGTGVNVFRWTITNGACPPSSDEVIVDRYSSVTLAFAGTDQTLCTSTATLTGTTPQSGTGLWTLVSGTGTITNPTSSVTTVTGLGNGDNVFRWTISNIPCPSSADDVVISTTLSAVTANAGTDQTVCGAVSQLIGNNPGTGTGVWTLVSGSGNITNPNGSQTSVTGLGAGVNVFSWTVTSGACQPSVDQVQITVVTNPVAANAGADQTICGSSANLTANAPGQGVGSWSLVSGSGTIGNPTSTSTTVIGLGNGANVFRWTISNAPCAPSFDEITINATPGNVSAQAGTDKIICGSSTFLNATAPGTGFGVWSLVSGSGTIAQPGNPVSEITNLGSGINTFAWTVTSGSCNASDLVQITKEINTLDLGDDSITCIGTPVVLNAGSGYADYSWFDNSGTPTVTVGASGQYWVQVLTSNGCSFRDTIKVTFVICTDVEQTLTKSDVLEIYPNPGNGFFHLNFESASAAKSTVRMYNSTGVQVLEKELDLTDGKASQDLDLRGAPSGLYIMEVQNDKVRHIRKLIVR